MSKEKFALITGGGVGIGKASALALARAGWNVAVAGRRLEPLQAAAKEIEGLGRRAFAQSADVGDPASVTALFARVEKEFGRLDLLFNNAGVGAPAVPIGPAARAHTLSVPRTPHAPRAAPAARVRHECGALGGAGQEGRGWGCAGPARAKPRRPKRVKRRHGTMKDTLLGYATVPRRLLDV